MPRVGLNTFEVVASGAELADESGIGSVSLVTLAWRLGVKPSAWYEDVDGIGDCSYTVPTCPATWEISLC